jgi:hypothetical protein
MFAIKFGVLWWFQPVSRDGMLSGATQSTVNGNENGIGGQELRSASGPRQSGWQNFGAFPL